MRGLWQDRNVRIAILVAGGLLAVLLVFCLGALVGASAFRPFGANPPFRPGAPGRAHGAVGTVTAIQNDVITMQALGGQTEKIGVGPRTGIEIGPRRRGKLQDIQVGDRIVVIGSPGNGMIQARFIRVIRPQPANPATPTPPAAP